MLDASSYKIWSGAGWPNSFYKGTWKEGSKVCFMGDDGMDTLVLIEAYKPYNFISVKHIAVLLKGGVQDKESNDDKSWIGTTKHYTFKEENNVTELIIDINANPLHEAIFNDGWPNALQNLKEICEE